MANGFNELNQSFLIGVFVGVLINFKIFETTNHVIKTFWNQLVFFHDFIDVGSELIEWFRIFAWIWFAGVWNWWFRIIKERVYYHFFNNPDWNPKDPSEFSQIIFLVKVHQLVHFIDFISNLFGYFSFKRYNGRLICLKAFNFQQLLWMLLLGEHVLRPLLFSNILNSECWLNYITNNGLFDSLELADLSKILN